MYSNVNCILCKCFTETHQMKKVFYTVIYSTLNIFSNTIKRFKSDWYQYICSERKSLILIDGPLMKKNQRNNVAIEFLDVQEIIYLEFLA